MRDINVNITDNFGKTPLFYASQNWNLELTELLVDMGANVNAKDKTDKTPLYYAQKKQEKEEED